MQSVDPLPGRALREGGARAGAVLRDVVADGPADAERGGDEVAHDLVGLGADLLRLVRRHDRALVEDESDRAVGEGDRVGVPVGAVVVHGAGHDSSSPSSGMQPSAIGSHR